MPNRGRFIGGIAERARAVWGSITSSVGGIRKKPIVPFGVAVGVGMAPSYTDAYYKAVIPTFLYKPAFGFPLSKDVPEIRRLSNTPYITMITNTACNEIAALEWNITTREGKEVPDEIIEKTRNWFYDPNRNEESLELIIRTVIRDILELDAGVIVKVFNLKNEFTEMYVRDGGTFTKSPDIYGVMPIENAYWQYGWSTGARPIAFDREEIVYMMMNPSADTIYGTSPVENLVDVLQLLTYGVDSNLEYFSDNNIPKGVFQMIGANKDDVEAFGKSFAEQLKKKDVAGNWRRHFHKMPVVNTDGKFERIGFSNLELELIQQQQWFTKIVWACFNITPSELGFTEDSNRATEVQANVVIKRKLIKPLTQLLEYHFNTQIVNDLPWIKGKYEDIVIFEFDKYDLQEDLAKRQIVWGDIKEGFKTVNEVREEMDLPSVEGGDILRGIPFNPFAGQSTDQFGGEEMPFGEEAPKEEEEEEGEELIKKEKKALTTASPIDLLGNEKISSTDFKKKITEELDGFEELIKKLIAREVGNKTLEQIKALDTSLIKQLMNILNFDGLKSIVDGLIKDKFNKGVEVVESKLDMNFVPNQRAINFVQDYTFDNVKGLEKELKEDLRQELQRGIMNGEGVGDLSKRVDGIMKVGKVRAKAIARTETIRAENLGRLDAYRQSGLEGEKEWIATVDKTTSALCKALNGTRVDINKKFEYRGEEFDSPPAHVNCRSRVVFHPKKGVE